MTMAQSSTIVGVFPDGVHAEQVLGELRNLGFQDERIDYVIPGEKGESKGKGEL